MNGFSDKVELVLTSELEELKKYKARVIELESLIEKGSFGSEAVMMCNKNIMLNARIAELKGQLERASRGEYAAESALKIAKEALEHYECSHYYKRDYPCSDDLTANEALIKMAELRGGK